MEITAVSCVPPPAEPLEDIEYLGVSPLSPSRFQVATRFVMEKSFMPKEVGDDIDHQYLDDNDYDYDDGATFDLEEFAAMGINPSAPTTARPGSEEKVLMLSARYAAGMPLWHDADCYDHGPNELQLMGNHGLAIPSAPLIPLDESEEDEL